MNNLPNGPGSAMFDAIQEIQTSHRSKIAETWDIPLGARLLEIGCGQGDMTAVLARVVGPNGHVTAIDAGPPDYGSPQTLQEATDLIKASELGERITFHFEYDLLSPTVQLPELDAVVLAHSSWYFESSELLRKTLRRAKNLAPRLFFAEWDLQPRTLEQVPHMLAVLIQVQRGARSNIRTPLTVEQLTALIQDSGWTIESKATVETPGLQDADWEIAMAKALFPEGATDLELALLTECSKPSGNRCLSCFNLVAT